MDCSVYKVGFITITVIVILSLLKDSEIVSTMTKINNEEDTAFVQVMDQYPVHDDVLKEEEDEDLDVTDMNAIRQLHPVCFSDKLFDEIEPFTLNDENEHSLKLFRISTMKYALIGKNVTSADRYNHLCPFMKNRYNCAVKKRLKYGDNPTDWKLVLDYEEDGGGVVNRCNLWNFIHDMNGPAGFGQEILKQRYEGGSRILDKKETRRVINVAIFGNSYLRQVFESLMCSWSNDLTYHVLQKDATYNLSLAGLRERKRKGQTSILMNELGDMMPLPLDIWRGSSQCRIQDVSRFYESGIPTPHRCEGYINDIAMAEFGHVLRVYYMFRPYAFDDLNEVVRMQWNVKPEDIDFLVFNDNQEKTIESNKELISAFETSGAWQRRIIWPYETFRKIQERDIQYWFGANNPWITKPPDGHACMPGAPDDEVNLMLFLMLQNAILK